MRNYSKRTALFIRALLDELPANRVEPLIFRAKADWLRDPELSGRERGFAEALGFSAAELDAALTERSDENLQARLKAEMDLKLVQECWALDRYGAEEAERTKKRLAEVATRLGLGPAELATKPED